MLASRWSELVFVFLVGNVLSYWLAQFRLRQVSQRAEQREAAEVADTAIFLLEDDYVVDASDAGYYLLEKAVQAGTERDRLLSILAPDFPELADVLKSQGDNTHRRLYARHGSSTFVDIDQLDGLVRVTLSGFEKVAAERELERVSSRLKSEEIGLLRQLLERCPTIIWKEDLSGRLVWGNPAYLQAIDAVVNPKKDRGKNLTKSVLLSDIATPDMYDPTPIRARHRIFFPEERTEHWVTVTSIAVEDGVLRFAEDANDIVYAERAQKESVQSLSRTFADLSVGLAIFDRRRRLISFNPALLELTQIPFKVLSARPQLETFLHQLREARRLPESKSLENWRDEFLALEAAARKGTYSEVWELADGLSFRVTGRPQADGAIALAFDDISAEILLTRRFRTEIETAQTIIDTIPEAIAVFSRAQTLIMFNKAYQQMWNIDPGAVSMGYDITSAFRLWRASSDITRAWNRLERVALRDDDQDRVDDEVTLNDGRMLACRAVPLPNQMTMFRFKLIERQQAVVRKLTLVDPALSTAKI